MANTNYTDAQKAEYWKQKALSMNVAGKATTSNNRFRDNVGKKFAESKNRSGAQMQVVGEGSKSFNKLFAWKYTRKFGLMSLQGYKMKNQATKDGEAIKKGFEKWRFIVKTPTGEMIYYGFKNSKGIFFFDLGTSKCAISVNKNYWAFIMPKGFKKR